MIPSTRTPLCAALLVLAALAVAAHPASAANLYTYDLDSLCHLASDIVEAKVVKSPADERIRSIDFRVTRVHKGDLRADEVVHVFYASFYCKSKENGLFDEQPLATGDSVFLFLRRTSTRETEDYPPDVRSEVFYKAVGGGMRLLQNDRIFAFYQYNNPGSYLTEYLKDGDASKLPTVEGFREMLAKSVQHTEELNRFVEADQPDVSQLLKIMDDRKLEGWNFSRIDYFSARICDRLADAHDFGALDAAFAISKHSMDWHVIASGFHTPAGREYIFGKVADDNLSMETRLRYARALRNANSVYVPDAYKRDVGLWDNGLRSTNTALSKTNDDRDPHFLLRVAKLARSLARHEELCCQLVNGFDIGIQHPPRPLSPEDAEAFAELKAFYDERPSEEIQFAIERVALRDPATYESLHSPCGPVASIVRPNTRPGYAKGDAEHVMIDYEYRRTPATISAKPVLILASVDSQTEYVLDPPDSWKIATPHEGGRGGSLVTLPADLPHGEYRLYLQFKDGDETISTGHACTLEL